MLTKKLNYKQKYTFVNISGSTEQIPVCLSLDKYLVGFEIYAEISGMLKKNRLEKLVSREKKHLALRIY